MLNKIKILVRYSVLSQFRLKNIKDYISKNKMITGAMAVLFIYLGISAFGQAIFLAKLGLGTYVPVITFIVIMIISLTSSFLRARDEMYNFKNRDLFLTYPLKISWIVHSRFIISYLFVVLITSIVSIPFLVSYLIYIDISFLKILYWIILLIIVPIIPICISLLVNTILSRAIAGFRNNNYLYNFLAMVLAIAVIILSMYLPTKLANSGLSFENMGVIISNILDTVIKYIFPLKWIYLIFKDNNVAYILLYISLSMIIYILTNTYINKKYLEININLGKKNRNSKKIDIKDFRGSKSTLQTLFLKEAKAYFNSRIYMMNTFIGSILVIVFSVFIMIYGVDRFILLMELENSDLIKNIFPYIGAIMISMACTTHVSISFEGKNIWFIKTMPISRRDFYNSKILLYYAIALPAIIVFTISGVVNNFSIMEVISTFLIPFSFMVFISILGLIIDLKFLNYNWESETKLVKQNFHVLLIFLFSFVFAGVGIGIISIMSKYVNIINFFMVFILNLLAFILYRKALSIDY